MLLWLWCRLAAPIPPLAWELPCTMGKAPKSKKKERKRERERGKERQKERKKLH